MYTESVHREQSDPAPGAVRALRANGEAREVVHAGGLVRAARQLYVTRWDRLRPALGLNRQQHVQKASALDGVLTEHLVDLLAKCRLGANTVGADEVGGREHARHHGRSLSVENYAGVDERTRTTGELLQVNDDRPHLHEEHAGRRVGWVDLRLVIGAIGGDGVLDGAIGLVERLGIDRAVP